MSTEQPAPIPFPREAAEAAAAWWAQWFTKPAPFDAGENSPSMRKAQHLASMTAQAMRAQAPADAVERFKTAPADLLMQESAEGRVTVRFDYGPDRLLHEALRASGLKGGVLPWKTSMRITHEQVTVSCGYGKQAVQIWPVVEAPSK